MNQLPQQLAPTKSFRLFGCRVDRLSASEILNQAQEAFRNKSYFQIVTGNALMLMAARHSTALRSVLENSNLVTIESSGLAFASRLHGGRPVERLAGIDLAFRLCEIAAQNRNPVYLLGGKPGVAQEAATSLQQNIPNLIVAGTRDGYFPESQNADIARQIKSSGAGLILVALGAPRQELWLASVKNELPPAVVIGVGGSFDVWSGRVKRAPAVFQKMGLEWLYRLIQEPYRYHRMLKLPVFALLVLFERISRRKSSV